METLRDIIAQEQIEQYYGKKNVYKRIGEYVRENKEIQAKIDEGVAMVEVFITQDYYFSKNVRLAQLKEMNIRGIVESLVETVCTILRPEIFTSVVSKVATRLGFDEKVDALKTAGEILAVVCNTDLYDINKAGRFASLELVSKMTLPDALIKAIESMEYLPPMVCEPLPVTSNYQNGYLTYKDSMVLGNGNHHDGDLCLDVINIMNKVALKLDTDFLSQVEEEPTFELDTQIKADQWTAFKAQSYEMYKLIQRNGNNFHLTHKVDKRGRIYAQGYHISTQSTAFKKAMIELANEEIVDGC